jgi:hypothetical protein
MMKARILASVGGFLLALGAFSPFMTGRGMAKGATFYLYEDISLVTDVTGIPPTWVLLGLAVAIVALSALDRARFSWLPGAAAFVVVMVTYVLYVQEGDATRLTCGLCTVANLGIGWGWAPLMLGIGTQAVAPFMGRGRS